MLITSRFRQEESNLILGLSKYFYIKRKMEHDLRLSAEVNDQFNIYAGVNNLFDEKPSFGSLSYPTSAVGRSFYAGVKMSL